MSMTELTKEVLSFSGKEPESKKKIREKIQIFIYQFSDRLCNRDEDTRSEFFLYFNPKIDDIIARFRYKGVPFEGYLVTLLMWQIKTFLKRRNSMRYFKEIFVEDRENFFVSPVSLNPDFFCYSAVEEPLPKEITEFFGMREGRNLKKAAQRKLLVLIHWNAYFLSDEQLEELTSYLDLSFPVLKRKQEHLRKDLAGQEKNFCLIRKRVKKYYRNLLKVQQELREEYEEEKREQLRQEEQRKRYLFAHSLRLLEKSRPHPTHRSIAELMSLPQGTVHSLFYMIRLQKEYQEKKGSVKGFSKERIGRQSTGKNSGKIRKSAVVRRESI